MCAAIERSTSIKHREFLSTFGEQQLDVTQIHLGETDHRANLDLQVDTNTRLLWFGAAFGNLSQREQGTEEIAAVERGTARFHLPHTVGAQCALHFQPRHDIEGKIREIELAQPVVGTDRHPSLNGYVVTRNLEVLQLNLVRAA